MLYEVVTWLSTALLCTQLLVTIYVVGVICSDSPTQLIGRIGRKKEEILSQ